MFALIDCNNFYASCERLFRPDLQKMPIIVLSNNDGCVIARSNETKSLGVSMGEPYFKVKSLCQKHRVHVFSSNYTLYGDISNRVMSIIKDSWPDIEIYSIDEAFLDLKTLPLSQHNAFCEELQQRVLKEVGIPTSIGIGKTKTQAKLANYLAKKIIKTPVVNLYGQEAWLERVAIGEVWGIGRQCQKKLMAHGIQTAADLSRMDPHIVKEWFNVVLMRTAMELSGTPCAELNVKEKKKSIVSSKSFACLQTEYVALAQAISSHCARVYDKLRQQESLAKRLSVFVETNRFRQDLPQYRNSITYNLTDATDDVRYLTRVAKFCLKQIALPGFYYNKVGVELSDLGDKQNQQLSLFQSPTVKTDKILSVCDAINHRFGRHSLYLLAEGGSEPWMMRREMKSPNYTTQWSDLPIVVIKP